MLYMKMKLPNFSNLNNYEWWRNHRKVITYGGFVFLLCLYIRPIVRESYNRNICALVLTDMNQITRKEAAEKLRLKTYKFTDYTTKTEVIEYPLESYCNVLQTL